MIPDPSQLPRRALVALVGLTPQIVTETLYALVVARTPPFLPTELHLLTTTEGRDRVLFALMDAEAGAFGQFCRDFDRPGLESVLTGARVHVIGEETVAGACRDILSPADNAVAADLMVAVLRDLTADPDTAVHVSIAGGRKSMSFLLGYVLSLFGREQDRLSHVLVSEPFESLRDFFYPPPRPRVLFAAGGRPLRTDQAHIRLNEIPFVRLRSGLPADMLNRGLSYSDTVASAQARLEEPFLTLLIDERTAMCGRQEVRLSPSLFAVLLWFARLRTGDGDGTMSWQTADRAALLECYAAVSEETGGRYDRLADALKAGITKDYFEQRKAALNSALKRALGALAGPYLIAAVGKRPSTRYRLTLPSAAIRILAAREKLSIEQGDRVTSEDHCP